MVYIAKFTVTLVYFHLFSGKKSKIDCIYNVLNGVFSMFVWNTKSGHIVRTS